MPKKGGKRSKTRTHEQGPPEGATVLGEGSLKDDVPKSIVAKASKVGPQVGELVRDVRKLMGPYTASNLREKSYNRMKDFAAVAGQLGVTHLMVFSQTDNNVVMRVSRFPSGPTLHFKIEKYSLARQVRASQKRPFESPAAYMTPPLVVLNNFSQSEESQVKLMKATFQHMYPTINVKTVRLSECRRVVLFNYNKENGTVEMRHYAIRATPVGISKSVKKIIQSKIPDLGKLQDISQFIDGSATGLGAMSDSEAEDENSRVTLPDRFVGKGNSKAQQSAMKLSELGPRMTLEIFKVEQGVNEGDVLYHKFVHKSKEEAQNLKSKIEKAKALKAERKAIQEQNVKRKREALEEAKRLKQEKRRKLEGKDAADGEDDNDDDAGDEEEQQESAGDEGSYDEENDYEGSGDEDEGFNMEDDEEDEEQEEEDEEEGDE